MQNDPSLIYCISALRSFHVRTLHENQKGTITVRLTTCVYTRCNHSFHTTPKRLVRDTRKFWFQQDLARPHAAKVSRKWCKGNLPNFIDSKRAPTAFVEWPVEAFFGELKRRVYKAGRYENLRSCSPEPHHSTFQCIFGNSNGGENSVIWSSHAWEPKKTLGKNDFPSAN